MPGNISHKQKLFAKHVIKAARKLSKQKKTGKRLSKSIKNIKESALNKRMNRGAVEDTLQDMDNILMNVLDKENTLLDMENKESSAAESIRDDIREMQQSLIVLSERDTVMREMLLNKIRDIGNRFKDNKRLDEDIRANSLKTEMLSSVLGSLKSKVEKVIEIKQERQKRIQELEEKIKSKVDKNFQEILRMEDQLGMIIGHYEKARLDSKHDPTMLEELKEKIELLKNRLERKKQQAFEKRKFPSKISPEDHLKKPIIKHEFNFGKPDIKKPMPKEDARLLEKIEQEQKLIKKEDVPVVFLKEDKEKEFRFNEILKKIFTHRKKKKEIKMVKVDFPLKDKKDIDDIDKLRMIKRLPDMKKKPGFRDVLKRMFVSRKRLVIDKPADLKKF